jgi:hypothetical protein
MSVSNGQNQHNHIGGPALQGSPPPGSQAGQQNMQGPAGQANPPNRVSNTRYRSFAERFVIERIRNLQKVDDQVLHQLTLQARTAYKMIKETGYTLDPSD